MEGQKPIVKKEFLVLGFIIILGLAGALLLVPKNSEVDTKKTMKLVTAENASPTTKPGPPAEVGQPKVYSMEEVKAHADEASCWTVVNGNVYDITSAIDTHKGGRDKILSLCGIDGTSAFEIKHGGQEKPENRLDTLKIGTLQHSDIISIQ